MGSDRNWADSRAPRRLSRIFFGLVVLVGATLGVVPSRGEVSGGIEASSSDGSKRSADVALPGLGVRSIEIVSESGPTADAAVLDENGAQIGEAQIDSGQAPGVTSVHLRVGGMDAVVQWDRSAGEVSLSSGNEASVLFFDRSSNVWSVRGDDAAGIRSNEELLELAGELIARVEKLHAEPNPVKRALCSTLERKPHGPDRDDFNYCPCTGPFVRGHGTGSTRSECCEVAQQDAHLQCSNSACLGCCRMLPRCDGFCGIGDYFCICGISGQGCSWEDRNCEW